MSRKVYISSDRATNLLGRLFEDGRCHMCSFGSLLTSVWLRCSSTDCASCCDWADDEHLWPIVFGSVIPFSHMSVSWL